MGGRTHCAGCGRLGGRWEVMDGEFGNTRRSIQTNSLHLKVPIRWLEEDTMQIEPDGVFGDPNSCGNQRLLRT